MDGTDVLIPKQRDFNARNECRVSFSRQTHGAEAGQMLWGLLSKCELLCFWVEGVENWQGTG